MFFIFPLLSFSVNLNDNFHEGSSRYDICYAFTAVLKDRTVVTWGDKDDVIVVM